MKRLIIALVLTCALSISALAGDIPTIGKATPSPTPTTQSTSTSSSIVTTILLTVLSLIR